MLISEVNDSIDSEGQQLLCSHGYIKLAEMKELMRTEKLNKILIEMHLSYHFDRNAVTKNDIK